MKSLKDLLYLITNQSHLSSLRMKIDGLGKHLTKYFLLLLFLHGVTYLAKAIFTLKEEHTGDASQYVDSCSVKYIRVNIHFMLKNDNSGNFREEDDGNGNPDYNGYFYARDLVSNANHHLSLNPPMNLPVGNKTPNLPVNYRYVLSGVYFHRDDSYYKFDFSFNIHSKYGIDKSSSINIYMQEKPEGGQGGVAAGIGRCPQKAIKLHSAWKNYLNGKEYWYHALTFNHEIGHLLGLQHSYLEDGCDDTPDISQGNFNCWNINHPSRHVETPPGGCEVISNNLMDHNVNELALTPCQLEIINFHLSSNYKSFVICGSTPPPTALFSLSRNICYGERIILDGSWRAHKPEEEYTVEIYQTNSLNSPISKVHYWTQTFPGQYEKLDLTHLYPYNFISGKIYRIKLSVFRSGQIVDEEVRYIY